jgi:hypothetical protein
VANDTIGYHPHYCTPRWVEDGMEVYAPVKNAVVDDKGQITAKRWLLCVVACAMGNTARVVNELHGIDTWFDVDDLRIKREGYA